MIYFSNPARILPEITLAGTVYVPSPNKHFPRKPMEFILYYIREGEMKLREGDTLYYLKPGDVLILDPARMHEGVTTESDISYDYIHFTWNGATEREETEESIRDCIVANRMNHETDLIFLPKWMNVPPFLRDNISARMKEVREHQQDTTDYAKTLTSCYTLELLVELARSHIETAVNYDSRHSDVVLELLNYVHNNCKRSFRSEDIEESFHMNFDYLNRRFRQKTGTTIMNYATQYRMQESRKLLRSGFYSVRQVASLMGYTNEFYFSRLYKKHIGYSPVEEKNNFKRSKEEK